MGGGWGRAAVGLWVAKSMGKGRGALDATFKMLCMAMYAAYVLIGLSVGVIGVLYWSSTAVASGLASALLLLSGLVMVGVGSAAIYGIHTDHVLLLSVVWCAPVAARVHHYVCPPCWQLLPELGLAAHD